ncbi:MAG: hypothetical protein IKC61_04395 [Clostridia bacterium]|nr:hypothetical protein [Clostridia bacterium]
MALLQNLMGKKKDSAAPNVLMASVLKRAKSPDQCKCIDFFMGTEEGANAKKGCLSKGPSTWTIDDYIAHVDNEVNKLNLKQRAIEKIGLDESQISEIPPVVISSFARSGEGVYFKATADWSRYVTNKFYVTWIFFSATQLYTYTYVLDTMTDNAVETTRDFFYSDITCIRTEHEVEEVVYEIKEKGCLAYLKSLFNKSEEKFARYHKHWDTLQITVPSDSYSFYCRTTPTLEQSIQAAKAMIREKKES